MALSDIILDGSHRVYAQVSDRAFPIDRRDGHEPDVGGSERWMKVLGFEGLERREGASAFRSPGSRQGMAAVRDGAFADSTARDSRPLFAPSHGPRRSRPSRAAWFAGSLALGVSLLAVDAAARGGEPLPSVQLAQLPVEARETDRLIRAGGPFPYPHKDGAVFSNRERALPARPRGEYREYTVKTPGSRDRGARRIVCAGRQLRLPDVCYYSGDHYSSFQRIER